MSTSERIARRLANSPSEWPPMPSATAHTPRPGCSRHASSLTSRTRPGWEREADVQRNGLVSMLMGCAWLRPRSAEVEVQCVLAGIDVDHRVGGRVLHVDG